MICRPEGDPGGLFCGVWHRLSIHTLQTKVSCLLQGMTVVEPELPLIVSPRWPLCGCQLRGCGLNKVCIKHGKLLSYYLKLTLDSQGHRHKFTLNYIRIALPL